jgi:hypothetical protein
MLINRNFFLTHQNDSDFTLLPPRIRFAAASLFWKKDDLLEADFSVRNNSVCPSLTPKQSPPATVKHQLTSHYSSVSLEATGRAPPREAFRTPKSAEPIVNNAFGAECDNSLLPA